MRYQLEMQETTVKPTAVYARTAQAVIHTSRWKQLALSDDLEALKQYARSYHRIRIYDFQHRIRILDRETGEEVFRTAKGE